MDKLKLHSKDLTAENIEKLAALFPNCLTETKAADGSLKHAIDFDLLRQELSADLVEGPQERYRLDWPGKREALATANAPIAKTLRPCREESVDFDSTKNLFIEGDNLEGLKLLQESYLNQVKLIYIDPPYNTGNDFIYEDDFSEKKGDYFKRSNQIDENENRLVANRDSNGRFHSDWLAMMFPRLKLARNLLREDGVIFISIDHGEIANLSKICDEVFGAENFCGIFVWEKKKKPSFLNANMGTITDYILAYSRSRDKSPQFTAGTVEDGKKYPFNNAGNPESILRFAPGSVQFRLEDKTISPQNMSDGNIVTELLDELTIKNGTNSNEFRLRGEWRYSQRKLDEFVKNGDEILISKAPFRPNYINRSGASKKTSNFLSHRTNGVPTNEDATEEIRQLFETDVMSYPKPTGLLKFLVKAVTSGDDLILDFFAGSATTADAVMQLNAEDGDQRRYLMIQLDEKCEDNSEASKAGYETISALARERIRRAGAKIRSQLINDSPRDLLEPEGLNNFNTILENLDLGFRALKVDTSNMADVYYRPDEISQNGLGMLVENIKTDRSSEDLLFQVLLDWGVELTLPIEKETICGKTVFLVAKNTLAACFETALDEDFMKELAKRKPLRAVFRDASFATDETRINIEQIFKAISPHSELKTV